MGREVNEPERGDAAADKAADARWDWAARLAAAKRGRLPGMFSTLLFRVGPHWFGLPIEVCREVTGQRPIHSLPHRQNGAVVGLANIGGELIPAVSLGHFLGEETPTALALLRTQHHRLLVVEWETSRFVFPTDEADGPHCLHPSELKNVEPAFAGAAEGFLRGMLAWRDRTVGLLNVPSLFPALNEALK